MQMEERTVLGPVWRERGSFTTRGVVKSAALPWPLFLSFLSPWDSPESLLNHYSFDTSLKGREGAGVWVGCRAL